jgi:hypothetical protein
MPIFVDAARERPVSGRLGLTDKPGEYLHMR